MAILKKGLSLVFALILALGMVTGACGAGSPDTAPVTNPNPIPANQVTNTNPGVQVSVTTKKTVAEGPQVIAINNTELSGKVLTKTFVVNKAKGKVKTVSFDSIYGKNGKALKLTFKPTSLKKLKKMKTLRISGGEVTFGKGAFSKSKKLRKIDLSGCEGVSFNTGAFKGLTKAQIKKIKITLPKGTSKKVVKKLRKMGFKAKNITIAN